MTITKIAKYVFKCSFMQSFIHPDRVPLADFVSYLMLLYGLHSSKLAIHTIVEAQWCEEYTNGLFRLEINDSGDLAHPL
jgi:hypothetical protein